jgi:hypothetical protein
MPYKCTPGHPQKKQKAHMTISLAAWLQEITNQEHPLPPTCVAACQHHRLVLHVPRAQLDTDGHTTQLPVVVLPPWQYRQQYRVKQDRQQEGGTGGAAGQQDMQGSRTSTGDAWQCVTAESVHVRV